MQPIPPASETRSARNRRWAAHALCLGLLVLACLALRVPSLGRISLNPDENQYEARAAYHLATGTSAFEQPYGATYTVTLYRWVGRMFGPYAMFEVRVLVLSICMVMVLLLYALTARATRPSFGLLAGTIFLFLGLYYEGLSANREWFSGLFVLLGFWVHSRRVDPRAPWPRWTVFAAGLLCGMGFWFKLQAGYLQFGIPAAIVWGAVVRRRWRDGAIDLVLCGAGGLFSLVLYFLPYLLGGTFGAYFGELFNSWDSYVADNAAVLDAAGRAGSTYLQNVLFGRPFPGLLVLAYAAVAAALVPGLRRAIRPGGDGASREAADMRIPLVVCWFVTALLAVQQGRLFFDHYYLYLLPPLGALCALAAHRLWEAPAGSAPIQRGAWALFVVLVALRLGMALHVLPEATAGQWPGRLASWIVLGAGLLLVGMRAAGVLRRAGRLVVWLILIETALLVVQARSLTDPGELALRERGFPRLLQYLDTERRPGDRLFVWGWAPEIYSLSRMEPASHFSTTSYIVNDYQVLPRPRIDPALVRLMMDDLEQRPPRFIVDAARRSWTMELNSNPWVYWLDLYPDLEFVHYLRELYDPVGTYDDCVVYLRR